jgi:hypothetical protein
MKGRAATAALILCAQVAIVRGAALRRIGSGWTSIVFRAGNKVIKYAKPRIPQADMMPVHWEKMRLAYLDETVELDHKLLESPYFEAFRHVITRSQRPRTYLFTQDFIEGIGETWFFKDQLSEAARRVADGELNRAAAAGNLAAPGADLDFNSGNVLFDANGHFAHWFDRAGGYWWALKWKQQQPGYAEAIGRIRAHAAARGLTLDPVTQPFWLNDAWAQRVHGDGVHGGEGLLVFNPRTGNVYTIDGFRSFYEGPAPYRLAGRKMPVMELLGPPTSDQLWQGAQAVQRFERGQLTWSADVGFGISLSPN